MNFILLICTTNRNRFRRACVVVPRIKFNIYFAQIELINIFGYAVQVEVISICTVFVFERRILCRNSNAIATKKAMYQNKNYYKLFGENMKTIDKTVLTGYNAGIKKIT